jgi:hypothetical protein
MAGYSRIDRFHFPAGLPVQPAIPQKATLFIWKK